MVDNKDRYEHIPDLPELFSPFDRKTSLMHQLYPKLDDIVFDFLNQETKLTVSEHLVIASQLYFYLELIKHFKEDNMMPDHLLSANFQIDFQATKLLKTLIYVLDNLQVVIPIREYFVKNRFKNSDIGELIYRFHIGHYMSDKVNSLASHTFIKTTKGLEF